MAVLSNCNIFFHLILLCMIHVSQARDTPKGSSTQQNIETAYDSSQERVGDHLCLDAHGCHNTDMIHGDHGMHRMELSWNILFHIEDLKVSKKIPLYFSTKNSSQTSHLIPKEEADSIPFSLSKIEKILEFFDFPHGSPQGKAIQETLNHCELPPLEGETKFCATSLESMLEELGQNFREGSNFRVLTTTQVKNWAPHLQNYTILKEPKEVSFKKMFGCHPMPYPYVVYYCHGQESDNRLFVMSLAGEDGLRLEALAICHMDTSHWDPNHASFRLLGLEPGKSPVCHVFPEDNLIWISYLNSDN